MPKIKSGEKTTEQLTEDLRKTREELAIQQWGTEKTMDGMKVLVTELIQKGKEVEKEKIKDEILAKDLEKFKLAVDNVSDQIIITDPEATILYINNACEKTTGYTAEEAVGEKAGKLWGNLMERSFYENLWKIIKIDKKTFIGEIMNQRKNNQTYTALISISPILDKKGAVEFFVGIGHDITKEKEVDRAKTEFVSLASHQLRTPLTGIEWTIELFSKKEKLTEEGKKYLNDIHFSASRLSALVKLLLNVSRIESGNVGVSPESLELVGLVNQYMREFQILCDKKKLSFVFAQHPEKLNAVTDKNLLGFILQNIIGNAIEYTLPQGQVEIVLEKKGEAALFTVRDTGIGVPKKEQARIFEKFIRASNAVSIKPDGTGLGLYIVSESIKLLGGRIWFESEEGRGSVFFVELPLTTQPHAGKKGVVLLNKKGQV
ncbi:MAG: ATP-binding protein [bacterium]|nr:ATP-binding protein [bacterium]